jgi:hypothetical protein
MQRRRFLRSAGACGALAMAGCADAPTAAALSVRTDPQPSAIHYAVEVERPPTETTPLTLRITISNPDATGGLRYGERRRALFWVAEVDAPFGTYPQAGVQEQLRYDPGDRAWQLADPFAMTMDYQWGELGPEEAHSERVVMVNGPGADPLVPVTAREAIAAQTSVVIEQESATAPTEVTWGFEVVSP